MPPPHVRGGSAFALTEPLAFANGTAPTATTWSSSVAAATVSSPAAAPRTLDRSKPLWIMHIPKTAVQSLCRELIAQGVWTHPKEETCHGSVDRSHTREACLSDMPVGNRMALFRSPREHALSQYAECRFDTEWDEYRAKQGQPPLPVPGKGPVTGCDDKGTFSETCLSVWLAHAAQGVDSYKCYHPWNLQSRQATCQGDTKHIHLDHERFPDAAHAIAAFTGGLDVIGITDLYEESWCLLQHRLTGNLPADCNCQKLPDTRDTLQQHRLTMDWRNASTSKASAALAQTSAPVAERGGDATINRTRGGDSGAAGGSWWHDRHEFKKAATLWHSGEVHDTHGVPHLSADGLSEGVLKMLDAATAVDRKLYANLTVRFVGELCDLQKATGRTLLCPGRLRPFRKTTSYISGLWEDVERSLAGCVSEKNLRYIRSRTGTSDEEEEEKEQAKPTEKEEKLSKASSDARAAHLLKKEHKKQMKQILKQRMRMNRKSGASFESHEADE